MFYGEFNHNGILWAVFLMLKSLLVGVMLTSCEVEMCSVPCSCAQDGEAAFTVTAPLLSLDGKVWTIASMYVTEFLVLVFFSPDNDLFNGYKMAFQQMQQVSMRNVLFLCLMRPRAFWRQVFTNEGRRARVCEDSRVFLNSLLRPTPPTKP